MIKVNVKEEHTIYEEDCLRNPFAIKTWLRYVEFVEDFDQKVFILQRAVQQLPRSYKLWKSLLDLRVGRVVVLNNENRKVPHPDFPQNHPEWQLINGLFESCLVLCNKFPLIWMAYCEFLALQSSRITFTRRTFDRALKAIPVTQQKNLWEIYLAFAENVGGDTTVRVWRRFLKIQPSQAERFVDTLLDLEPPRTAEAARVLTAIIENPVKYANPNGKTTYQYWSLLCKLIIDHSGGIEMPQQDHLLPESEFDLAQRPDRLDVEKILRAGIKKFSDQVGTLWNSLARWWILQGAFEKARDVFEEGIRTVNTVKDFTMIFDAYAKMEESVLSDSIDRLAEIEQSGEPTEDGFDVVDVDLRLARFERLMVRRPFLANDVILRQNPHNVDEWKNRVKLYMDKKDFKKVVDTFAKACKTISAHRASGSLTQLWIDYARFHEDRKELALARAVFKSAVKVEYARVDDLAHMWCQWAEMEIRNGLFSEGLRIVGSATAPLSGNLDILYNDESKTPQQRLFKSVKLWSFYVDLEESVGTVESTKAVYDRILELKIAVPQIIINYASFLEENNFFEESFRVYERGIELFGYPIAFEIWNLYLTKFIKRYEGTKLERARDLFEQALEKCPAEYAKSIFLLYAKVEEDYGLARHALRIYDRAVKAVSPADLYDLFVVYIAKATSFFGIISTREIYSKALEVLPDRSARDMALQFSDMEIKLGEVDRSRAIFGYISQLCDPRSDPPFWNKWHEFEVKYGNEDTYKEMLRIKRSVQAKFNADINFMASQILASRGIEENGAIDQDANNQTKVAGFVRAAETEPKIAPTAVANPDEIQLDDEESSDEEDVEEEEEKDLAGDVQKKSIPAAVFGGLASQVEAEPAAAVEEKLGAKDRFKRKRG